MSAKSLQLCPTLCDPMDCRGQGQAPLSVGFSRQEYWSVLPWPPPGNLSQPRDRACVAYVSCIGRWGLYHWWYQGLQDVLNSNQFRGCKEQRALFGGLKNCSLRDRFWSNQVFWGRKGIRCFQGQTPHDCPRILIDLDARKERFVLQG